MTPELAVTGYLADHGWPSAEATMNRGIDGTDRVLWVVAYRGAEHAGDDLLADWVDQARADAQARGRDLGVLVTPRADYGPARVASWWAHVDVDALSRAMRGRLALPDDVAAGTVRMHLSTAVLLVRAAGYGTPLGMGEAA